MSLNFDKAKNSKTAKLLVGVYVVTFMLSMTVQPLVFNALAKSPSIDLDQSFNGSQASPASPVTWGNGDANPSNSHFIEGQSMPYRAIFSDLVTSTTYSFQVEFDITKSGKHALDFITKPDRISETVNPCSGVSPCSLSGGLDIPTPPVGTPNTKTYFENLETNEGNQQVYLYNATGVSSSYIASGDETSVGDSTAIVEFSFVANNPTVVIAWGGHIASEVDWGAGNGATGIRGSPYHTSLGTFSGGNVGGQDKQLKASAVTITPPQQATLHVVKHVINDNGGTLNAGNFTINVTGTNVSASSFSGSELGTTVTLDAGSYSVTENAVSGYSGSVSTDCSGTIGEGEEKTCTITNNDVQPLFTVTKVVVDGDAQPSDFPLYVGETSVTNGEQNGFNAGDYVVSEINNQADYTGVFSGSCDSNGNVTLNVGDVKTCTLTNTYQAPEPPDPGTLHVVKHVITDNGGTAVASDFTMNVDGTNVSNNSFPGSEDGVTVTLDAGSYSVSESGGPSGYTMTSDGCSGSIASGEEKTCTITNDDQPGTLVVKKVVVGNDDNPSIFSFTVNDGDNISFESDGQNDLTVDAGTYSVVEVAATNYDTTYNNCSEVSVTNGGTATCTVTNTYNPPDETPTDVCPNIEGNQAEVPEGYFLVDGNCVKADVELSKTVDDTTPSNGQQVTYTVSVTNNGPDTANGVKVTDALPVGLTYVSADATQGSYDPDTNTWTVGTLANGESATMTMHATVTATEGTITNAADVVIDPNIDINTDNNHDQIDITVTQPECQQNCETEPTPPPTPTPTPPGGGGGGCSGCEPYEPPSAPPVVLGAVDTPTPTPTPQVLGATTLPDTGFSFSDSVTFSLFMSFVMTGMVMMMIGFGAMPKVVLAKLEEYLS